jgi:hypothetical protein
MLDPFELLGITPNASVREARAAYFELAKVCHPDRGDHPEDMHILKAAYQWVSQQLEGAVAQQQQWEAPVYAEGTPVTGMKDIVAEAIGISNIESIVEEYAAGRQDADWFRRIAHDFVLTWIYADVCRGAEVDEAAVRKYVVDFAERMSSKTIPAAYEGGYGEDMVDRFTFARPVSFGTADIVIYKEPEAGVAQCGAAPIDVGDIGQQGYGTEALADYKQAMKSAMPLDGDWEDEEVSCDEALERMRVTRELQDKLVLKPSRIFLGGM